MPGTVSALSPTDRAEASAFADWLESGASGPPPAPPVHLLRTLVSTIDATLLTPGATRVEITRLCADAREAGFVACCVSPIHVTQAVRELSGSRVVVATVIGFPSGAHDPWVKAYEASRAVEQGAKELDMVLALGLLRSGEDGLLASEISGVVRAARGRAVKVILETAALTLEEKVRAVRICREAGASFVKTSTGFGPGGATVEDVALLRSEAGETMGVKASGGIRSAAVALRMISAGADRIGTSSGRAIISEIPASPRPDSP